MGVLEPVEEAFLEEVPTTPPGVRDKEGDEGSEDDLYADPVDSPTMRFNNANKFNYNNDLTTINYKNILMEPALPLWARFGDDFIGMSSLKTDWELQKLKKKSKYCSGCEENVKKDLKKLENDVDNYRNERDAARKENEILKKELEELKLILKKKEEQDKGDVNIRISNYNQGNVDVILKKSKFEKARTIQDTAKENAIDSSKIYGITSFSINLDRDKLSTNNHGENKSKKTIAELRREFFAKEFQSEQTTFVSKSYLEVKPQEEKEIVRSRLNIRVKPKQTITELISKLTSKINGSKIIPEAPKITMFQRFEKTRTLWENHFEKRIPT